MAKDSSAQHDSAEDGPAEDGPDERGEAVEEQRRPNALIIHETIRAEGEEELERSAFALLASGLAAGLSMGISLIVQGKLHEHLPAGAARDLVSPWGYTVGFLIVVIGRQQLFTENTLTPVLPLLRNRDRGTFGRLLRLWGLVLAANILGTFLVAAFLAGTSVFDPATKDAFAAISHHSIASPFATTFSKAIVAGWIIALMVWLLPAAEGSRPAIIAVLTYVVSLAGLAHVVAGSVDAFYLVNMGEAGMGDYLGRFFVPTLLGNIAGGVALVAVLNYGQVVQEIE